MKRELVTKILSVFFIFLLLSSSSYAVVKQHFCCDQLVDLSINDLSASCEDEADDEHCNDDFSIEKACCDDLVLTIDSDNLVANKKSSKLKITGSVIAQAFVLFIPEKKEIKTNRIGYLTPLRSHQKDHILFDVFLI